jgi:CRISPR system Cascade subunit CasC
MYVELHLIQNFPYSCLNRDDANLPKDCEFGGVRRARISSQSQKRAIRVNDRFASVAGQAAADRSKQFGTKIMEALGDRDPEECRQVVSQFMAWYGNLKSEGAKATMLYVSPQEVAFIADTLRSNWAELLEEALAVPESALSDGDGASTNGKKQGKKKSTKSSGAAMAKVQKAVEQYEKDGEKSLDIALFGRMLAGRPSHEVTSALQVAHAFSTHRVEVEPDFFSAVDDLNDQGSGHIDYAYYNSSCYYRYMLLDWSQLLENVGGDQEAAMRAAEAFLRTAIQATPTAKKSGTDRNTMPSFVLAAIRDPMYDGWSLANAFERPVRPSDNGWVGPSIGALDAYWGRRVKMFGTKSVKGLVLATDSEEPLTNLASAQQTDVETLVDTVLAMLAQPEAVPA